MIKKLKDIALFSAIFLGIIVVFGMIVMAILAGMGFRWGCV